MRGNKSKQAKTRQVEQPRLLVKAGFLKGMAAWAAASIWSVQVTSSCSTVDRGPWPSQSIRFHKTSPNPPTTTRMVFIALMRMSHKQFDDITSELMRKKIDMHSVRLAVTGG